MADIKILTGNHRKHNNSDLQYHNLYYQPPRQFEHLNIMLRSKYKDNFWYIKCSYLYKAYKSIIYKSKSKSKSQQIEKSKLLKVKVNRLRKKIKNPLCNKMLSCQIFPISYQHETPKDKPFN